MNILILTGSTLLTTHCTYSALTKVCIQSVLKHTQNRRVISYIKTNSMNCAQRKQLTDLQKGEILALNEEDQSQCKIAKTLKIPRPTIEGFLQRFQKHAGLRTN